MNQQSRNKLFEETLLSIGNKDPIEYFKNITILLRELFNKIDHLESQVKQAKFNAALAIDWDAKLAADMISKQIDILRSSQDKDLYKEELRKLKAAYSLSFNNPKSFVDFWIETLGYHPFLDYNE